MRLENELCCCIDFLTCAYAKIIEWAGCQRIYAQPVHHVPTLVPTRLQDRRLMRLAYVSSATAAVIIAHSDLLLLWTLDMVATACLGPTFHQP